MIDSCSSSLNTIESNSTLTASRLNNIQNKLAENTDGSGDTAGELLKSIDTNITTLEQVINNGGLNVNLADDDALSTGLRTSSINCIGWDKGAFFGKSTTLFAMNLEYSVDNTNWYTQPTAFTPNEKH